MDFLSEEDMCTAFIEAATKQGYVCYPETHGWDILLVKDGFQIGIQAKLKANLCVLRQAMDPHINYTLSGYVPPKLHGPNIRAVLVPQHTYDFRQVAHGLRIFIFEHISRYGGGYFYVPDPGSFAKQFRHTNEQYKLPDVVPILRAGISSPIQLTAWKIKAFELCRLLRKKGYVTTNDFKALNLSSTRWINKWITKSGKEGKLFMYVPVQGVKLPDELYPELAKQFESKESI